MTAVGGEWPIAVALDDFPVEEGKDVWGIAEDLASIEAEWIVLEGLVHRGWLPVHQARSQGSADWFVRLPMSERDSAPLGVDAKLKRSGANAWILLTWMLRGMAMTVRGEFLTNYDWRWDVPLACRDSCARSFVASLWDALPALQASLQERLEPWQERTLKSESTMILGVEDEGEFTITGRFGDTYIELRGTLRSYAGAFDPGGISVAYAEEIDSSENVKTLNVIFGRLGMIKQARRRTEPTLFVIAWIVPPGWEIDISRDKVEAIWHRLSEEHAWPAAVLWPIGGFEAGRVGWITNRLAGDLLGRLQRHPLSV